MEQIFFFKGFLRLLKAPLFYIVYTYNIYNWIIFRFKVIRLIF